MPPTQPVTHPIVEVHGAPWWATLLGPVIAVAGALLAQWFAHRWEKARDAVKQRDDDVDSLGAIGYECATEIAAALTKLDRALAALPGPDRDRLLHEGIGQFGAARVKFHSAARRFLRRHGNDELASTVRAANASIEAIGSPFIDVDEEDDLTTEIIDQARQWRVNFVGELAEIIRVGL